MLLLRAVRQGHSETDEIATLDKKTRSAIASYKEKIQRDVQELADKELQLALLADIVDEFLVEYRRNRSYTLEGPPSEESTKKEGTDDR